MSIDAVIESYAELWGALDPSRCATLAEACLTEDALIVGPGYRHQGRAAIIREAQRHATSDYRMRGVITSGYQAVEQWVRFSMAMVDASGAIVHEGWNFLELAADGRICRVVSFWGRLPPPSDHWPERLSLPTINP